MTQYVEWDEPWQYAAGPQDWVNVTLRMTVEDAIRYQRGYVKGVRPDFEYKDDDGALRDFIYIRWGVLKGD